MEQSTRCDCHFYLSGSTSRPTSQTANAGHLRSSGGVSTGAKVGIRTSNGTAVIAATLLALLYFQRQRKKRTVPDETLETRELTLPRELEGSKGTFKELNAKTKPGELTGSRHWPRF